MQRQSHKNEQKFSEKEIGKNRFVPTNSTIEQGTPLGKPSPWRRSTKSSILITHSEMKRLEALSAVPLANRDDILNLRSHKQHRKYGYKHNEQSIITINVSGDRFQTHLSTLQLYPNTLLGDENKRKPYWNPDKEEYFFDRHRACFDAILYYYQSNGRLRRPTFVPLDTFLEEISFFQLGTEASAEVHQQENIKPVEQTPLPRMLWRRYIWYFFEYPQHSSIGRTINIISLFFTILSCVSLAIESLPKYTDHWDNLCKLEANISLNSTYTPRCSALFTSPFFIIQTICVAYFTIEFLLRISSTPSYRRFVLSFFNWVDLTAIVPYYAFLIIQLADKDIGLQTSAILFIRISRVLRFSRIFKIYLVFKRLKSLRVLSATVRESLMDFAVMITSLTLLAFLFGAATYFAEQGPNGDVFDSIPKATYWGIITITGVGYGDMCPITAAGRILTCLCALVGSATMGMLVSVLVDRYQRVFNRKMYVSEPEISPDLDMISNAGDDVRSLFSARKTSRRRGKLSMVISHSLASIHEKIKNDRPPPYNLQFVVSFNDDNKDHIATDHVVTVMKEKLKEAISNTDVNVNLKLVDNDHKELWAISSSDTPKTSISEFTLSSNIDDIEQSKNEVFF